MAEINITPFTDVVLVLLIIFMITTPLMLQSGIAVNLPKASSAESTADRSLVITVDAGGSIFLGSKKVSLRQLSSELSLKLMHRPDTPVVVKGDRDVKYDTVIQVIDAARQSGAKKFALSVEISQS